MTKGTNRERKGKHKLKSPLSAIKTWRPLNHHYDCNQSQSTATDHNNHMMMKQSHNNQNDANTVIWIKTY